MGYEFLSSIDVPPLAIVCLKPRPVVNFHVLSKDLLSFLLWRNLSQKCENENKIRRLPCFQKVTEYLFVEMKTMPVCLRFQQSTDFLIPGLLLSALCTYLPASWRYLSLLPCPPHTVWRALLSLSLGVSLNYYFYSCIPERLPFYLNHASSPLYFLIGGRVPMGRRGDASAIPSSGALIPHHCILPLTGVPGLSFLKTDKRTLSLLFLHLWLSENSSVPREPHLSGIQVCGCLLLTFSSSDHLFLCFVGV